MQKSLIILVFLFSLSVFAEDISDFQIEGISVGDSALEHFSLDKILTAKEDIYCDVSDKNHCNKFYSATFWLEKFKSYDAIRYHAKNKDKKHIIYSINGEIDYPNNIEECLRQRAAILKSISENTKNLNAVYEGTFNHGADKSGKTKVTTTDFEFPNRDRFFVSCVKWSKESGFEHTLNVNFEKKEFSDWILELYK